MRKVLSVLIALFLLLACTALAESLPAETGNTYTHPKLGYSLTPAEGWLLLDESIVNSLLNDLAEGNSPFSNEILQQFYAQLNGTLVTAAYSPDRRINLNIGPEYFGIDADIQTLAPALRESVAATMSYASVEDEGSIVTFGQTDYLRICVSYEMSGVSMRACQYIAVRDGMGYYLTFTAGDSSSPLSIEEIETSALPFLESFRTPEVSPYATYDRNPYTHPDDGYSLSVPANWLAIDRTNIGSLLEQNPNNTQLEYVSSQIESHNLMISILPGTPHSLNVLTQPIDKDATLLSLVPSLLLTVQQDYASFGDVEFLDTGSIVQFGETDFFRASARIAADGRVLHINQYYACHEGTVYIVTLTYQTSSFTAEIMDAIARPFLESFTLPSAD